jgi:hypothetical protein
MGSEVGAPESAAPPAERFRDRARSATTLVVTAAGALVAGFVFSPIRDSLSPAAQIAGFSSLVLFIASGCFYLQASLHSKPHGTGSRDAFVQSVIDSIRSLTRYGSISGLLASIAALAIIPLDTFYPEPELRVKVQISGPGAEIPDCPELKKSFLGWASPQDLRESSVLLPLEVDSSICGNDSSGDRVKVYLARSTVTITLHAEPVGNG